jgi:Glycosyl transferase family 2
MKLCGVAMVANESDIIEAFARHTLAFTDHLHIAFHNSYDSSREIVERLIDEGLGISHEVIDNPVFQRERLGCEVVQKAAARNRFDYILPLDADEFIAAQSRSVLEAELAAAPADGALSLAWLSYVPTQDDDPADPNPVARIRRRLPAPHPHLRKVFFRGDLMQRFDDVILADGNHLLLSRHGREIPERKAVGVHLAHYPVRSAAQIASKAVLGSIVRQVSPEFTDHQSRHWRALMNDPALAEGCSAERLSQITRTYFGAADSPLIDNPLEFSGGSLRYADLVRVDPFARLTRCLAALTAAGALRPIEASSGPGSGRMISVSEAEQQSLLAELDTARRVTQHLHQELGNVRSRWRYRFQMLATTAAALLLALLYLYWRG